MEGSGIEIKQTLDGVAVGTGQTGSATSKAPAAAVKNRAQTHISGESI